MAAWSHEVTRAPMRRTLLGQPVLLWRQADGRATALLAACPHRWMPLDPARLVDGDLECPYHGARFDASGACVRAPLDQRAPPSFALRRFSVVERGPCVLIWMGDGDRAEPSRVPPVERLGLGVAGWRQDVGAHQSVAARIQLVIENLFDQSHIGAVHPATLGGAHAEAISSEVVEDPHSLSVIRTMPSIASDDLMRTLMPNLGDRMINRARIEMLGAGIIASLGSQTFAAEEVDSIGLLLGELNFVHLLTPETAGRTHYFTAITRTFACDDDAFSQMLLERNALIVAEDAAVLEALEDVVDAVADRRTEVTFASDAAAICARRRIADMIDEERASGRNRPHGCLDAPPP
ncbi:aromatic ring-hydroxylating dioxygenase subunit alpha [Phenylobacterium sp.]|uniref:aromatic ring-hydroxylating dioxygenase subunit alpha n=1 Tax=Phenylobacterium sp. TaxID=1871053 RepID=UPI0025FB4DE7|nr:aromatic ring-hydroxylating dioxygenase subunit alpha [Phenylobacterium sp.]